MGGRARDLLVQFGQLSLDESHCCRVAKLETVEVQLPEAIPEGLWGGSLDRPHVGDTADDFNLPLIGWIVGRDAPAVAAEIVHRDEVLRIAPLEAPRPDIALHYDKVPEATHSGWRATIDTLALPEEFELEIRAVLENGRRVPLVSVRGRREASAGATATAETAAEAPEAPTLQYDLRDLIVEAAEAELDRATGCRLIGSSRGAPADNHADVALAARIHVLDRLDVEGKTVLVLNSGLGELSRAARERGAALVDGFEPDPDRVSLARLAAAYHQAERVFFYLHDPRDERSYFDRYDVVLALSGLDGVLPALDRVAASTEGVFVAELGSRADDGVAPLKQRFPAEVELGEAPDGSSFVAFAKTSDAIAAYVRDTAADAAGAGSR